MDNFYITLPSNVVSSQYDNSIANYTTKLAAPISLEGNWEVGLSAISYTKSWYRLSKFEYIKLWYFDVKPYFHYIRIDLLAGNYEYIQSLISTINGLMKEAMEDISKLQTTGNEVTRQKRSIIEPLPIPEPWRGVASGTTTIEEMARVSKAYNDHINEQRRIKAEIARSKVGTSATIEEQTIIAALLDPNINPEFIIENHGQKISCNFGLYRNGLVYPEMSPKISQMLGFDKAKMDKIRKSTYSRYYKLEDKTILPPPSDGEKSIKSHYPYDLTGGIHTLYVYCDVVKQSFVGDSYTQLLRFVEIPPNNKFGDQVVLTYPDTHYIPVMTKEFQTIEVDIKDDSGISIPFEFGRTVIVLHFRKKK